MFSRGRSGSPHLRGAIPTRQGLWQVAQPYLRTAASGHAWVSSRVSDSRVLPIVEGARRSFSPVCDQRGHRDRHEIILALRERPEQRGVIATTNLRRWLGDLQFHTDDWL